MALISLVSASGSPGVTTASLAIALAAPRRTLLVEADPTGGSTILAGYLRVQTPHDKGLVNLAMANRSGTLTSVLPDVLVPLNESGTVNLVPGLRSHAQASTVTTLWEPLGTALCAMEDTGTDVLIDAGRLGLVGSPMALLRASDMVLLTTRTSLPALAVAKSWADSLRESFTSAGAGQNLGLLLIGEGRPFSAREVRQALGIPVVASLAFDAVSAETYYTGASPGRGFERRALQRSARAAVSAIWSAIDRNRSRLAPGSLVDVEDTP